MAIKSRWLIATLIVVLAVGPLVACSNNEAAGDSDQVVLRFSWWGSQDRHERTLEVIELFEKENPHIKIEPEFTGWDGYWDKRATQAAGGNLPDIVQMDSKYLAEYLNRGLLLDLNPYVEDGTIDLSNVEETYISGGEYDGKLYALSMGATAKGMAVDPEAYKKAGVDIPEPGYTWEEFMEQARQLKEGLDDKQYVEAPISLDAFRYYLRGQGKELFNEDGTGLGYKDEQLIEFFGMWHELLEEGVLVPSDVAATIGGPEDELIVHEKAPNDERWSNQFVALSSAAGRPLELTFLPLHSPDDKESYYLKPSMFLSISSKTKHPEEAAQFLDFMTNSLEAYDVMSSERGVPISSEVREYLYPKLEKGEKDVFDFVEQVNEYSAEVPKDPPGTGAVWTEFERQYEALGYGKTTPEKAAAAFRKEAEAILAKNK